MSRKNVLLRNKWIKPYISNSVHAARIDDLGEFKIWWRVVLPQVKPALSALGIITFLGNWNAYL